MSRGERRRQRALVAVVAAIVAGFVVLTQELPHLDLERILHDVGSSLGGWVYAIVGFAAFVETGAFLGLLLPGETAVLLGGAIAGQGETSVVATIAVVWVCAWAGDSASLLLGRRLGRDFVLRHGPTLRITRERFARVESYFKNHGGKTILIGRFIGLVRALAPFVAGSSGMRYREFVPFSILGTGLWATTFTLIGYFASQSLNRASQLAGKGSFVFGVAVAVIVAVVLAVRFLREPANRSRLREWLEAHAATRPLLALARRLEAPGRFVAARLRPGGLGLEFTALLAAFSVGAFALIAYWTIVAADPGPTPGDHTAFTIAHHLRTGALTGAAKALTELGSAAVTLPLTLLSAVLLALRRRWSECAVLVCASAIIYLAVPLVKDAVARPRPAGELVSVGGYAFPSGHAAHSVLYAWIAATLTLRLRPRLAGGTALLVAGILLAGLIGLTRVYLRVHFLSDVTAGWGLGVAAFTGCGAVAVAVNAFRHNEPDARTAPAASAGDGPL